MKKFIAIVLVLVTVLGLCACGKSGGGSGEKNYLSADGKVTLTIGLKTSALIMDHKNNELTKWVEEKCNVNLEFQEYAGGTDIPTQISTAIAARQELPDIIIGVDLNEKSVQRYGQEGYIRDLQDYFADKEGASKIFWDRVKNEMTEYEQMLVDKHLSDPETGAIYAVPMVETSLVDKLDSMVWINKEWMDKLGLENPTNNEELYEVLKAFKENDCNGNGDPNDEIPLYGATTGLCTNVISWLTNTFTYYDRNRWWMVDENNKIYVPFTKPEFRDAMIFMNKLYKEGLLSNMMFSGVEPSISTPTNGVPLCGIFLGHMNGHVQKNNDLIYQYEPLEKWGCSIMNDMSFKKTTFITDSCPEENVAKAFEVLMTLWSWDGSMRQRYGAYGENWTEPDPGAVSDIGLECTYKLLSDPFGTQNTVRWSSMCGFNAYAECETAQTTESSPWLAKRIQLHAETYKLHLKAAEKYNVAYTPAKPFTFTTQEADEVNMLKTNTHDYFNKTLNNFIRGESGMDPKSDASWNEYLNKLDELGLSKYIQYAQTAYDRAYPNG